jgi:hypothetical protein
VEALMRGDYNPEHFKYLRKKKWWKNFRVL